MSAARLLLSCTACALMLVPAASARSADTPPSGDAAQAIAWLNTSVRRPLSLPDLTWDAKTAQAATAHANYLLLNPNPFGHEEIPGKHGFTGVEPWDRCAAVGAAPCSEIAAGKPQLPDAAVAWLGTPYHGLAFFETQVFGCGESKGGSVCDVDGVTDPFGGRAPDDSAPVNSPASTVRMWPYDGVTNIAPQWTGGEIPDPLDNYPGNKADIGPSLFVGSDDPVTASLHDANGAIVPLLAPDATTPTPTLRVGGSYGGIAGPMGWYAFFPARKLKQNEQYIFTVTNDGGRSWTTRFTTAALDTGLEIEADPGEYNATIYLNGDGAAQTVTFTVSDASGHELTRAAVKAANASSWAWPGFRRGGTFTVCADLPSHGPYGAAHACQTATFPASTRGLFSLGPAAYHGSVAVLTLHTSGVLVGRRAAILLIAGFRENCGGPVCGGWPRSRNRTVTVTLRPTQTFQMPFQSGGGWTGDIHVTVAAFTVGGRQYAQTFFDGGADR